MTSSHEVPPFPLHMAGRRLQSRGFLMRTESGHGVQFLIDGPISEAEGEALGRWLEVALKAIFKQADAGDIADVAADTEH